MQFSPPMSTFPPHLQLIDQAFGAYVLRPGKLICDPEPSSPGPEPTHTPTATIPTPADSGATFFLSRLRVIEKMVRGRIQGEAPRVRVYDEDRLANMARAQDNDTSTPPIVQLAARLGLSFFEIDVLCLVAGAHLDYDFRALIGRVGGPQGRVTESLALAILLPTIDWRLQQRASLSDRGALVAGGFLRPRGVASPDLPLTITRRALAILQGNHPLDELPLFARVGGPGEASLDEPPVEPEAIASMMSADESNVVVVGGSMGMEKIVWARSLARLLGPRYLELDLATATLHTTVDAIAPVVSELIVDGGLLGLPVVIANYSSDRHGRALLETIALAANDNSSPMVIACEDATIANQLWDASEVVYVTLDASRSGRRV